jgi:hypothetical protein
MRGEKVKSISSRKQYDAGRKTQYFDMREEGDRGGGWVVMKRVAVTTTWVQKKGNEQCTDTARQW